MTHREAASTTTAAVDATGGALELVVLDPHGEAHLVLQVETAPAAIPPAPATALAASAAEKTS